MFEEHQIQVVSYPPLPPRYMYVSLSLKTSFSIHVVYVLFYLYYLTLTYFMLCRHPLSHWCLKRTKARLFLTRLFPPARYMYVSLSLKTSFSVHVVYMSMILFIIWIWHMLFYAGFYWGTGAWRAPDWWPSYDEPACTFMYCFLVTVILMIQHVLF